MKIACPQCGGETRIETPDPFTSCSFCHASLYIDLETVAQAFTFAPTVERERISLYVKKDVDKVGLGEELAIREVMPVYLPFWRGQDQESMRRAHSLFPVEHISPPSATSLFFDPNEAGPDGPQMLPVDLPPPETGPARLYLVPFYGVRVQYREISRRFFVNAVNGGVYGERLPVLQTRGARRRLVIFCAFLASMLAVNWSFDHFLVALLGNLAVLAIFYLLMGEPVPSPRRR